MSKLFSKSDYTKGLQCPKMLWLSYYHPELFDDELVATNLLEGGHEVGELAQKYHEVDFIIEQNFDFVSMAKKTSALLSKAGCVSVAEATFIYNGLVCMADIVVKSASNVLDVYECKATTKLKDYHLDDLAFQIYVIQSCGYKVDSANIMHINGDYVLGKKLDLDEFFVIEDVTEEVFYRVKKIEETILYLRQIISSDLEPEIIIGKRCNHPHACGFQNYCCKDVPSWLFSMAGIGRARAIECANKGIKTKQDFVESKKAISDLQASQLVCDGNTPIVRQPELESFMDKLSFPLYFLDFETVQTAVPIYQGTRPYAQVPTQFSLHWLENESDVLHHTDYLAPSVGDPRRGVAEALCKAIPKGVCTTAYNMSFEKTRIKEMAQIFPDLEDHLMDIYTHIVDLMVPFQKGYVYLPAMQGSYSIKKVLPALYPDDPELDYHALVGVHNGSEAMNAFANLCNQSEEAQAVVRQQLLDYCKLDTLAMVKVWQSLRLFSAAHHKEVV